MKRRALWVVVGLWAGLMLVLSGTASAEMTTPYPAPPITQTSIAIVTTSAVAPPAEPPAAGGGTLPNTGAGFDMGATLLIGGAILLVGVALTAAGARRLRRH